jgi:predicted RNase H-like nuclease (RuvC/YqgF family)
MPPAVLVSKSVRAMPDQVDGLQPAAKGGRKRTCEGRFQSWRPTKAREELAEAAETGGREESSQDVAASTQRLAAELTTLQAEVERLSKENEKLAKQTESLQKQLESKRQRSRSNKERVKELSAATVKSDMAHAEQLAKVCSERESLSRTVRKLKTQSSNGSLSAARCREEVKAVKACMPRRAYGGLRRCRSV